MKHNPLTAKIPVLILTGLSKMNAAKLIREGADGYLEKSVLTLENGSEPLLQAIQKTLEHSANIDPSLRLSYPHLIELGSFPDKRPPLSTELLLVDPTQSKVEKGE